jgi:release factor glutamine methyltransferase
MSYIQLCHRLTPLYGPDEAKAIVRTVLDAFFGMSLTDIVCGSVEQLSDADAQRLEAAMRRLEATEPVQYVLGSAPFSGRQFAVKPGVLIPRPETEWLVERIKQLAEHRADRRLDVLDIGTGSGCIAISTALDVEGATVEAWDISPEALSIARDNARDLGADVTFTLADALNPPAEQATRDIIVSNPPYICRREQADMAANVLQHEPHTALFVSDDDPQLFYRAIALYAQRALRPGGTLLFECNTLYAADTAAMLCDMGFAAPTVHNDCFGKPRFVEAGAPNCR